jgi:F1F0 ATPase subunit 2
MSDIMMFAIAFGAGLLLGAIFYGGLNWTVKKGLSSHHAGWWFTASLWLRLGMAAGGFYLIGQDDWRRMLICLAGFLIARVAVTMLTKNPDPNHRSGRAV